MHHFIILLQVVGLCLQSHALQIPAPQQLSTLTMEMNRRSAFAHLITTSGLLGAIPSHAATPSSATTVTASSSSSSTLAPVTHRVVMNVRISRQDGTFYVRDDLPDTPENRVFYGSLQLGLFGTVAPTCVEQFLSYISVPVVDDDPLPSYARSNFVSLNQATGLLTGGSIPSLQATQLSGSTALQYGGRILSAPLWVESNPQRVSHSGKGLLTHRNLEVLPTFGITTRADSRELDNSYTVFGQVLFDDSSREFLNLVESLPTYSVERPKGATETTVDNVAAAVYNSQREFFRSAAKTFGDTRLDKVYPGKLLRRVEVTQVELVR